MLTTVIKSKGVISRLAPKFGSLTLALASGSSIKNSFTGSAKLLKGSLSQTVGGVTTTYYPGDTMPSSFSNAMVANEDSILCSDATDIYTNGVSLSIRSGNEFVFENIFDVPYLKTGFYSTEVEMSQKILDLIDTIRWNGYASNCGIFDAMATDESLSPFLTKCIKVSVAQQTFLWPSQTSRPNTLPPILVDGFFPDGQSLDNYLINIANCNWSGVTITSGYDYIRIKSSNSESRTSASDAAVSFIKSKGVSIRVNNIDQ